MSLIEHCPKEVSGRCAKLVLPRGKGRTDTEPVDRKQASALWLFPLLLLSSLALAFALVLLGLLRLVCRSVLRLLRLNVETTLLEIGAKRSVAA